MMDLGGAKALTINCKPRRFAHCQSNKLVPDVRSFFHSCKLSDDGRWSQQGAASMLTGCPVVGAGTASKCHASLSHAGSPPGPAPDVSSEPCLGAGSDMAVIS